MRNDYSWVAEKKQEAMRQKLQNRGMPRYAQRPVSERFGVSYTGLGDDGQLDRSAPAGMDMYPSPHVYHEGETRVATPEGRVYLNADVTEGAGLGGQPQGALAGQGGPMPGFAAGGGMMARAGGYTGAHDAPQYAPRMSGNPYTATVVPGNRQAVQPNSQGAQQYQPRVQGWNVNPAAMGNYAAAMLAQPQQPPAPVPQQQPAPVPQQPNAPAPRVGGNPYMADIVGGRVPGFASGGGLLNPIKALGSVAQKAIPKVGDAIPTIGGGGKSLTSNTDSWWNAGNGGAGGSAPVIGAPSSGGASGSGSGINMAGGGQDTLDKSKNTGIVMQQDVNLGANVGLEPNAGTGTDYRKLGQTLFNPLKQAGQALLDNGKWVWKKTETPPTEEPATPITPEAPAEATLPQPPNPYLQNQIDKANSTPLTSDMFLRNPYTDKQIDDMRRQAASQQSYQSFQQAMRGTDANAAWAQNQMTRAQQEEGINNFAAAAAAQDWDKMAGMATDLLKSGVPALIAQGAQMYNYFLPGSGVDFTGLITQANAEQFSTMLGNAAAWGITGTEEQVYNQLKSQYGNLYDDKTYAAVARQGTMTDYNIALREFKGSKTYQDAEDKDLAEVMFDEMWWDNDINGDGKVGWANADGTGDATTGAFDLGNNKTLTGKTDENGKFTPDNPEKFNAAITNMAQEIAEGTYTVKKLLEYDKDVRNAVIQQLAVMPNGGVTTVGLVRKKQKKDNRGYFDLWSAGQINMIDGIPYYLENVREVGKSNREYDVVNLHTGEKSSWMV
jgi:hypothetical protein